MAEIFTIPIFPLNTVLFPYSKLPLNIFEERYKKMINLCINKDGKFGINLQANEKIEITGCTAMVDEITARDPNGELRITIKGLERYDMQSYEIGADGYHVGKVIFRDPEDNTFDEDKMTEAVSLYNNLVEIAYQNTVKTINMGDEKWQDGKRSLCYYMAQKSGLSIEERQMMLEWNTEKERLDFLHKYLVELIPRLKEASRISNIIKSDGYLQ